MGGRRPPRGRARTAGLLALAVPVVAAAALGGCGLGAGETAAGTRLLVTDDFGGRVVAEPRPPKVGGSDTVMRLLQRNAKVRTRYGGGFVQAIGGLGGDAAGARPIDWFFYVNGSLSATGAASVRVRDGDAVWWDRHDWGAGETHAVVGSFPAPFAHGVDGRRPTVRVECAAGVGGACARVARAIADAGALVTRAELGTPGLGRRLRVLVGPYAALRAVAPAASLTGGPRRSGIYARFTGAGRLELLDARGRVARTAGDGAGLVAATGREGGRPVWLVTGTDTAGVGAAANAMTEPALARRFAVAVVAGRPTAVPVP